MAWNEGRRRKRLKGRPLPELELRARQVGLGSAESRQATQASRINHRKPDKAKVAHLTRRYGKTVFQGGCRKQTIHHGERGDALGNAVDQKPWDTRCLDLLINFKLGLWGAGVTRIVDGLQD